VGVNTLWAGLTSFVFLLLFVHSLMPTAVSLMLRNSVVSIIGRGLPMAFPLRNRSTSSAPVPEFNVHPPKLKPGTFGIIAAHHNGVIGDGRGNIPWEGRAQIDRHFFKTCVQGGALIMGRVTWEETCTTMTPLGGVPGCYNVVVTSNRKLGVDRNSTCIASGFQEGVEIAFEKQLPVWVVGGHNIYQCALADKRVSALVLTSIEGDIGWKHAQGGGEGAILFPEFDATLWQSKEQIVWSEESGLKCTVNLLQT